MEDPVPAIRIPEIDLTAEPPAAPRAVTPVIARRVWTEPSVRVWWLATLLLAGVALAFVADRLYARSEQSRLIYHGVPTDGKIVGYGMKTSPGQLVDPGQPMSMQYPDPTGRKITAVGILQRPNYIANLVKIHYDPAHPDVWTDLTEPTGWIDTLFGVVFMVPIVVAFALFSWFQARLMRKIWQNAPAMVAVVSDRRQTPIAPMSWAVRCSLRDGTDRRLFTVHVPRVGGLLEKRSEFWVLAPKRGKRVAAAWFV